MKVLQVNTEKTWRGGERQTLLTMKGLLSQGIVPRLLCLKDRPLAQQAARESMPLSLVANQAQAFKYILSKGSSFDLIHAQTSRAQSLAVIARFFHQRPVLYTRRVDFRPRGLAAKLKYCLSDQLAAISPAIRDIILTLVPGRDIAVIPSCIDTSREILAPSAKALHLQKKFPRYRIIGTIAAMVPHKDPLTMVRTVHSLQSIYQGRFIFLHFGRGELEKKVRAEVKRLGIEDKYLLMGFENDVESYYPVLDLFVMSSQEEGLGSSVLEAFRYKVPVVSTNAGGLERLVMQRGLLCPVKDHRCLAAKIHELLQSPEKYTHMVQSAHEYVLRHHSLESMTTSYVRLYARMLEQRGSKA